VVEIAELVKQHRDATALLTIPPVSLGACELAVTAYGRAVSAAIADRSGTKGTVSPAASLSGPATITTIKVNS
jgi:hypothetical protein